MIARTARTKVQPRWMRWCKKLPFGLEELSAFVVACIYFSVFVTVMLAAVTTGLL
ncbi:MAG: hypothetical protein HY675_07350 [Chloroflexi bacterium]|nr:hypothetical protein [Chloroflexota bacterium]